MPVKSIRLLCAAFFILGAALALLLAALPAPRFLRHLDARAFGQNALVEGGEPKKPGKAAACGTIEAIEIPFANPDGVFPDRDLRLQQPKWFFESYSESGLCQFLNSCELRPIEKRFLLDKRFWNVISN